ncbi:MAG: sugar transferase [Balneolaceae bacterium]
MRRDTEALAIGSSTTVRESILEQVIRRRTTRNYPKPGNYYSIPAPYNKQYFGKRIFDLFLGVAAFMLFAALYPFIAAGIKLSSRGPVVFKQYRTGLNGHQFICYKFRTMHVVGKRTLNGIPDITKKGDSRIFTFGNFLRRTNLDELPQIINVMKGEMSLIGPRPYPVDECKHWNNTFNDFYYRYMVKPGVTGHAQVTGYRGGTLDVDHMRARLDKDLIYVQRQSLWLDVKIIVMTLLQMVTFKTNAH